MKSRLLSIAAIVAASVSGLYAQSDNLLNGLIPSRADVEANPELINNSSYFYNSWKCFDENGMAVNSGSYYLPDSYYTEVLDSDSKRVVLPGGRQGYLGGTDQGFEGGQIVAQLSIPYYDSYYPYCYATPINVPEEGDYVLSGSAKPLIKNENKAMVDKLPLALQLAIVYVAEGNLNQTGKVENKNFEIVNGKTIKVTDQSGKVYDSTFSLIYPIENDTDVRPFSETIHLTPANKYLSIYGPFSNLIMANLSLVKKGAGAVSDIECDDIHDIHDIHVCSYYDLNGVKVAEGEVPATSGVYVCRKGNKSTKVLVK